MARPARNVRLIDLHCDWLLQYACESTVFDASLYQGVQARLGQSEGYLNGSAAAIFSCFRRKEDWQAQADPKAALIALITRIEAEFPGRLLIGPDDLDRWREEPEGLCWGLIGVEGFDFLIREPADLLLLQTLFERGVRLFQPVYSRSSVLAGSAEPDDDRGLTPLGLAFINTLNELGEASKGLRPILDLAHLNPKSMTEVLVHLEASRPRLGGLLLAYSHGALAHASYSTPRALTLDNLKRLRALGGTVGISVGPPFYQSPDQLKSSIGAIAETPWLGKAGFDGIAIGTDFLGVDQTLPGLGNVNEVIRWIERTFSENEAESLLYKSAQRLIESAILGRSSSIP